MHGRIYIVLKESLKKIPILGWGMQFCQFIFLKRNWEKDKPRLSQHLQKFNKASDPMWLMMFPEGTNLADSTRANSAKWADKNNIDDMQHLLLPRSTGLQFCLQELRKTVGYVYDCTIAYEGVPCVNLTPLKYQYYCSSDLLLVAENMPRISSPWAHRILAGIHPNLSTCTGDAFRSRPSL